MRAHPEWAQAQRRLASLPPAPPRNVRITISHNEALVSWEAAESADAYLVERHGPQGSRVLGRTSMLEWTDSAPRDGGVTWTVRALRGQSASSEPVTATGGPEPVPEPETPGVTDLVAIAGRPVVLSWKAPEGAQVLLTRRRDDVTRTISPDPDGYTDRKVQAGATYEYTVSLDGVEGSGRSTTVTVPADSTLAPPPARRPRSPSSSCGAATTGAWRRRGTGPRAPPRSSWPGTRRRRRARPAHPVDVRSPTPATRSTVARRSTAYRRGRNRGLHGNPLTSGNFGVERRRAAHSA